LKARRKEPEPFEKVVKGSSFIRWGRNFAIGKTSVRPKKKKPAPKKEQGPGEKETVVRTAWRTYEPEKGRIERGGKKKSERPLQQG